MSQRQHPSQINGNPPSTGGFPLWLVITTIILSVAGIVHLTRPVASKTTEPNPSQSTATIRTSSQPVAYRDGLLTKPLDPRANRLAALTRDLNTEINSNDGDLLIAGWLADVKLEEIPGWLAFLQTAQPVDVAQDLSKRLIRRWAASNPEQAAAWLETLPVENQMLLLQDVAVVWANHQLTNAIHWAGSLPDDMAKCQALMTVAGEAVRSQPIAAITIAIDLPASPQRDDLICRGAKQWASEDAGSAAAWARQISTGDLRNETLGGIALVWSTSDPVAAANLALNELPPGRLLDDTVVSIVQRWAQQQPEMAATWVEQFPEGALREAAIANLADQWSQQNPDRAKNWLAGIEKSQKSVPHQSSL